MKPIILLNRHFSRIDALNSIKGKVLVLVRSRYMAMSLAEAGYHFWDEKYKPETDLPDRVVMTNLRFHGCYDSDRTVVSYFSDPLKSTSSKFSRKFRLSAGKRIMITKSMNWLEFTPEILTNLKATTDLDYTSFRHFKQIHFKKSERVGNGKIYYVRSIKNVPDLIRAVQHLVDVRK